MYDLVPPNMKAQFNSINLPNQSIKLSVYIINKPSKKKGLKQYSYNRINIFKYEFILKNSQYILNIFLENLSVSHFHKTIIGAFIYNNSIKHSVTKIDINTKNRKDLDLSVFGFLQKDFIYAVHKKRSQKSKYKTDYKLTKDKESLLNSINFLKELVSEPSNIIYPTSFVKRTNSQINKKNINIKSLNKKI